MTTCVNLTCPPTFILNANYTCVCPNAYYNLNGVCKIISGYAAMSFRMMTNLTAINNTVVMIGNYSCTCPAGFKFRLGSCVPCSFLGIYCPCPEGFEIGPQGPAQGCIAVGKLGHNMEGCLDPLRVDRFDGTI